MPETSSLASSRNSKVSRTLWDVFGKQGHPLRATVSEMGPLLIAALLQLNETQEGVLTIAFKYADDNGMLLLDLKDLQSLMQWVGQNAERADAASTATFRQHRSVPFSADCFRSTSRAAISFLASRRLSSTISCRPTAAKAS
jgi:hypothetical protein